MNPDAAEPTQPISPPPTPESVITAVVQKAKAANEADLDLIDILETHILKTAPDESPVDNAVAAIQKLAETRLRGSENA